MESRQLKEYAFSAGADLAGISGIDRFDGLTRRKDPRSIFPEARSVIMIGRRITRGTLRGVEEGTNFQNYMFHGYNWLENRFIAMTTFRVSEFLEDNGWEAVPLPNLPPEVPPMGVAVRKGVPEPNVMLDFDDAAVRTGLGEIGYCGIFLTPEFGPRQRFQMILTDAVLEPDPLPAEEICPRNGECGGFCPLGAFNGDRELEISGRKMRVAEIDYGKCASCKNGAVKNPHHPAGRPDRIASVCIRTCMDYLERSGRIKSRFRLPFRQRETWTVREEKDLYRM